MKTCLDTILKMIDQKIYFPENTYNFVAENLIETRSYEQGLKVLSKLKDHGKIGKLNNKILLKNFLIYDQSESASQFLQLLPLDV